jgi:protease I
MIARIAAPGVLAASAAVAGARPRRGKVLMPIGDATEMMDTLYPFFRLPEDGFQLVVAGPEARLYHGVMHEIPPDASIPWDSTREQPSYHIKADIAFRDVKPEEYVAIFISGGRAPEYLRYDKDLMRIVKHFGDAKKPIGFTCHGVEIATAAGVIHGCKVTTVAKCAFDAEQGGASYVNQPVVKDGHVISCGTWHDYAPFFAEFMKMLNAL